MFSGARRVSMTGRLTGPRWDREVGRHHRLWLRGICRRLWSVGLALAVSLAAPGLMARSTQAGEQVTIFAAASTTDAINEVVARFAASDRGQIRPVFASSSTLAAQILRGAPADIFLSASVRWMDHVAARGAIDPETRVSPFGNRLVLIAPADSDLSLTVAPGFGLADALGNGRLAVGDPTHVPAGVYAKAALVSLGAWPQVENKLAMAANVRAALALVGSGAAVAGIVYASDARITPKVRVVGRFPASSHPPIRYALAALTDRVGPAVTDVLDYLKGPEAQAIFERHGFLVDGPEG